MKYLSVIKPAYEETPDSFPYNAWNIARYITMTRLNTLPRADRFFNFIGYPPIH
jgi:hypothetical protein